MTKEIEGQMSIFDFLDPDIWSGKMSPEHSVPTREKTSEPPLKKRRKSQTKMPLFLDLRGGQKWSKSGCIMGDGWSIAWRVHDAQFWGVPQRRKRISLVADFGGETAPEILFERKSVSGDTEQSGEERERTSSYTEGGINPASFTLKVRGGAERDSKGRVAGKGPLVQTELSATLGVSQDQTLITRKAVTYDGSNITCPTNATNPQEGDPCHTLHADDRNYVVMKETYQETTGSLMASGYDKQDTQEATNDMYVVNPVYCLQGNGIDRAETAGCNGKGWRENESYTLNTIDRPAVCYAQDAYDKYTETEKSATIKQSGGVYGGGSEALVVGGDSSTVGALCARDYKGVGNQYVEEGKLILQRTDSI